MALGFKKKLNLPKGEDLAMMGGMGIAALGGPIAPLILAAMYKGSKENEASAFDAQQKEAMAAEDLAEIGRRAEQGSPMYQGERTMEGQLFGRQAMSAPELMGRVSPEFNMQRGKEMFAPEPEEFFDAQPTENGFAQFGKRGGFRQQAGARPPAGDVGGMVRLIGPNGVVKTVNEKSPGARAMIASGLWNVESKQQPQQALGLGEQYARQFGGAIPPGHIPEVGQDGKLTGRIIPQLGGPQDPSVIDATRQRELAAEAPGAKAALATATQFYDNVLAKIAEIENDPNTNDAVGPWEGAMGGPWGLNPLTAGGNVTAFSNIENLQDMLQVQGLQMMRDASKTGGAVGSVTEREWPKLSARFGNLKTRQQEGNFRKTLGDIKNDIRAARANAERTYIDTYERRGQGAAPGGAPTPGTVEEGYRFKGGNPSDPNNWERM